MYLTAGKWYKWTGGKNRPSCWNSSGKMDFMLDGKPHYCTSGSGVEGAFSDSPNPNREWSWADGFKFLVETEVPVQQDETSSPSLTIHTTDILAELFDRL